MSVETIPYSASVRERTPVYLTATDGSLLINIAAPGIRPIWKMTSRQVFALIWFGGLGIMIFLFFANEHVDDRRLKSVLQMLAVGMEVASIIAAFALFGSDGLRSTALLANEIELVVLHWKPPEARHRRRWEAKRVTRVYVGRSTAPRNPNPALLIHYDGHDREVVSGLTEVDLRRIADKIQTGCGVPCSD